MQLHYRIVNVFAREGRLTGWKGDWSRNWMWE